MAIRREVVEHLTDDFDGTPAAETIRFSFEGKAYVLDLSAANAKEMRQIFKPYVEAARRDGATSKGRRSAVKPSTGVDAKAVRVWAKSARVKVPSRGRIPSSVVEQYLASR